VAKLAEALGEAGVDAFFATTPITMGYLYGFHEHAAERFLVLAISAKGDVRMICPALSESQARRTGLTDIRPWKDGEDPQVHFRQLAEDWGLKSAILAVDADMPARMLLEMQNTLPAALFRNGETVVGALMARKEPGEIDLLRRAGQIADEAFVEVAPQIRAGLTERQVEKLLVDAMTARGGAPYFAIVAAGANSAEPHHLTDDTVLKEGDVLILDFGCDLEGYKSDITRTVAVGHATPRAQEIYAVVHAAHTAGRAAIRPGVSGADVDAAARKVIEDAGHGPAFFHRTGHGIGMNGHEAPYIAASNPEPLEAGNAFSIEPGIYYSGELGVRIENIVVATESGHESMNAEPSPTILVVGA